MSLYLLERSRSGNGGYIWIFLLEAVAASDARRLGNGLLLRCLIAHLRNTKRRN